MPGRKHSQEDVQEKMHQVEELTRQGKSLSEAIEAIGVGEATFYRWRKGPGSLSIDQAKRLKELELENARLRQAVLQLTIDKMALQELLGHQ